MICYVRCQHIKIPRNGPATTQNNAAHHSTAEQIAEQKCTELNKAQHKHLQTRSLYLSTSTSTSTSTHTSTHTQTRTHHARTDIRTNDRFDKVFSGQEFPLKIPSLPPKRVVDTVFAALSSRLPPTFLCDVFADEPFFLSPLVNTCQGFSVEEAGKAQNIFGKEENKWACSEDTELLGDEVPKNGEVSE